MRWKESILIALIFFGVGFIVGWHPTFETVRNFVITGLSLGLVFNMVGLFAEVFKERKEKKRLKRFVLSEIELNQNRLKPLADSVTNMLGNDAEIDEKLFPNELNFDDTINSDLSDKLRLLDEKNIKKTIIYYSELKYIEEEYKKLELIHGFPAGDLAYFEIREVGKFKIPKPGWHEIEEFLRHTKKAHDLGTELITDLQEKPSFINSLYNHIFMSVANEPLAMGHLRTGHPDIRKMWLDYENLKSQISKDKIKIREYIKNKSIEGIPLYSKLDSIFDDGYISQNEYGEIVNRTEADEIYGLVDDFAISGKLTKDVEYEEFVEAIIKDKTLYEIFETVRQNKALLHEKMDEFEQRLEKIKRNEKM